MGCNILIYFFKKKKKIISWPKKEKVALSWWLAEGMTPWDKSKSPAWLLPENGLNHAASHRLIKWLPMNASSVVASFRKLGHIL